MARKKKLKTPLPPFKVYECWVTHNGIRCSTRITGRVQPRKCLKCGGKLLLEV